jgi:hypothetical protein
MFRCHLHVRTCIDLLITDTSRETSTSIRANIKTDQYNSPSPLDQHKLQTTLDQS